MLAILRDLGCTVDESGEGTDDTHVLVTPPSWRPDLVDAPDYAEEVARIDGYNNIPSITPTPSRGPRPHPRPEGPAASSPTALAGAGFTEVLSYPFVAAELADQLGLPADDDRRQAVRIANPLSEERPLLRTMVLSSLVDVLRRNLARGHKDVAVSEIGLVFRPGGPLAKAPIPGVGLASRRRDARAAVCRRPRPAAPCRPSSRPARSSRPGGGAPDVPPTGATWWRRCRPSRRRSPCPIVVANDPEHAPWHPGRCARITLADGTLVGHAGELHPKVLAALDLPARTVAAEFDVDVLTAASEAPVQAAAFSTFPPALTDVALLVRSEVAAGEVEAALRRGAGEALESIVLFDVYEGERVEAGHRSLAYRLTFRAADRTLTTDEVNAFRDAAVAAAAEATGAVQR